MKHSSTYFLFGLSIVFCISLVSCQFKADVDLDNIDMSASVKASLSLPVGSMFVKVGDFLQDTTVKQITIDEQGRYLLLDTFNFTRSYHPINLEEYIASTSSKLNVTEKIDQIVEQMKQTYPNLPLENLTLPFTVPAGVAFDLEFPIDIDLTKMNIDYSYQRVDSIIVDLAHFTSSYSLENMDISWNDIKSIEIVLPDNFRNIDSQRLVLPIQGQNFGYAIPIDLRNFHLVLMKDPDAEVGANNIIDSISLKIRFEIQTSKPLVIQNNQYINYDFELNFIDYSAMFGYFAASNMMRDEVIDKPIEEIWSDWNMFDNLVLPISEPSISLVVNHTLALPMKVNYQQLYATSATGERRDATFDEAKSQKSKVVHLPAQIKVTDPLDKHAIDTLHLDYTNENGNIDTLFTIHPDKLSYSFSVEPDTDSDIKQFRITDDTDILLKAILRVPFTFNNGVDISYSDTITGINLTSMQIDSLLEEIHFVEDLKDTELKLFIIAENTIPFDIYGNFTLLDAQNNTVVLSSMENNTINLHLQYPESIVNGVASVASKNVIEIKLNADDLDAIASINKIAFDATLGDNQQEVHLTPAASIRLQIALAANIDAIIDLNELF